MKRPYVLVLFALLTTNFLAAQNSTALRVYQILQDKCATCHSNADPQSGLDLEGQGATEQMRLQDVYNNIVRITPGNPHAAGQNYKYIYPGRADRSFIFRKINDNLEPTIALDAAELANMPPAGNPQLSNVEKEMIRQWILHGADATGELVDEQVIDDFYNLNGKQSFPDGPPPAPAPGEGFQVKMGPFYLSPAGTAGDELEYFQKHELELPDDVDVDRLDIEISTFSHHFIIYDYAAPFFANQVEDGFRLYPDHSGVGLVAAVQEATDLRLPEGTAFQWDNNIILDLNSHYINYEAGNTYQAEAYVNVYTKPIGTAAQQMYTELIVNDNIFIPNDENLVTHTQTAATNFGGEVYLWGMMGHTHKYGKSYKVWTRENGARKDLIYDAGCAEGVPDCVFNSFDYRHIPMRFFEPLFPLQATFGTGIIHEASWLNDGPVSVTFGNTSDDEMMVLVMMFTTDTAGVVTSVEETPRNLLEEVKAFPNPMSNQATFIFPADVRRINLQLFDLLGREVFREFDISDREYFLNRNNLGSGMYIYRAEDEKGRVATGKLWME